MRRLWGYIEAIPEKHPPATWCRVHSEPIENSREVRSMRMQAYVRYGPAKAQGWKFRTIVELGSDGAEFRSLLACHDPSLIEAGAYETWRATRNKHQRTAYANRRAHASATQESSDET